jgi:signal transduction histidine kinase
VSRSQGKTLVAIGAAGLVGTVAVAAAGDIPAHDAVRTVLFSVVGSALAGTVAWLLLMPMRRSRIRAQTVVAALAPVMAVAIGVAWAASQMFIMGHDLWVLWVVLVGAGTVGLISALLLGNRVAQASQLVGDMARRLGEEGPGALLGSGQRASLPTPHEFESLAAELELTSSRLAETRDQAAALERSRRELVAWVSHDLRTPLAGIRAMIEALEDGVVGDPETVARYHRTIRREADRLAGLVDDLFELSRIQAGAVALQLERVALDELVSDAIAGASITATSKGIDLLGSVGQPSPVVELSTPQMARAVRNLVDNAIRYTPAGGTVRITARLDESGTVAEVSVEDTCGGIPEHDLDQVFEMAYRGDEARTPGDGGAGLGLAVARGLVEAHHGQITVKNEGGGCRFTIKVPVASAAAGGGA